MRTTQCRRTSWRRAPRRWPRRRSKWSVWWCRRCRRSTILRSRYPEIIAVIDGIAFQTNILALNAAVEAARAGEQGRGFAVVASKVRNLAQRSASAAKEIKELITGSVSKVENGTRLVDEAGKTMNEIVSAVKRVTDIMADIARRLRNKARASSKSTRPSRRWIRRRSRTPRSSRKRPLRAEPPPSAGAQLERCRCRAWNSPTGRCNPLQARAPCCRGDRAAHAGEEDRRCREETRDAAEEGGERRS